jgi:hypothetical protein
MIALSAEVGKRVFLKKAAKTFAHSGIRCGNARAQWIKVFWFFFAKKNCLLSYGGITAPAPVSLP